MNFNTLNLHRNKAENYFLDMCQKDQHCKVKKKKIEYHKKNNRKKDEQNYH